MAIEVTCPSCGNQGRFPDAWLGQSIECPQCRSAVVLTSVSPDGPPLAAPAGVDRFIELAVAPGSAAGFNELIPLASSPAPTETPSEARPAVQRWLDAESRRFEAHVRDQMVALNKQRQELVNARSQHELQTLLAEQSLSRKGVELDVQSEQLAEREQAVAARYAELDRTREELATREGQLTEYLQHKDEAERELAQLTAEADLLRAEANELRETIRSGRLELASHRDRRKVLEDRQAALDERTANCERREAKLGRDQTALDQRVTEVADLETRIERELEQRNRELDAWQRLLEERERNFPRPSNPPSPTPRGSETVAG